MYKELKLKANHNLLETSPFAVGVVIKCTKSWSWKQITTARISFDRLMELLSNVQRAEVESKSQLLARRSALGIGCYQMYKELKLKANHNCELISLIWSTVVIKCTKSWSWKQITTVANNVTDSTTLLSNVQRAEVESKSQLCIYCSNGGSSCYQMYKELKLKANHNFEISIVKGCLLLSNVQRAEVESKSQLPLPAALTLFVVIKCTKSWSWKQITTAWFYTSDFV